jgi:hypothetical protein
VAFIVCTALAGQDIAAVLTGGSAATVYAPHAYQSRDMDFILHWQGKTTGGAAVLNSLGYTERGQTWHHSDSPFTLEFPKGPLAVGDDLIKSWDTLHSGELLLHILTPTDCVRDRLMWFYLQPTGPKRTRGCARCCGGAKGGSAPDRGVVRARRIHR